MFPEFNIRRVFSAVYFVKPTVSEERTQVLLLEK